MWIFPGIVTCGVMLAQALGRHRHARWRGRPGLASSGPYEILTRGRDGRATTRIGVALPDDYRFVLREETRLDRWFKRRGLDCECQVGEVRFDWRIYIESDDPVLWRVLQHEPAIRAALLQAVAALGNRNATGVHVVAAGGRLWIGFTHPARLHAPQLLRFVLPLLHPFADTLSRQPLRAAPRQRDPSAGRAAVLLAASSTSVGICMLGWQAWALRADPMLDPLAFLLATLWVAVPLHLLLLWRGMRWLGPSARAHVVLLDLLLAGLPGLAGSVYWLGREANMALDPSPARSVLVEGAQLGWKHASRGSKSYFLQIPGAPGSPLAGRRLPLGSDTVRRLGRGRSLPFNRSMAVRISVRPGLFGSPWIERIEPAGEGGASAGR